VVAGVQDADRIGAQLMEVESSGSCTPLQCCLAMVYRQRAHDLLGSQKSVLHSRPRVPDN
jgi:hypothetical protein